MLSHLLFMRHAKSSWKDDSLADHARPLNKRGQREADIIAHTLTAKSLAPDVIWSSDAARTLETSSRLIRIIPGAQTIIKVPEFYHASAGQVLDKISQAEPPSGRLMLLGHNPGWSELAQIYAHKAMNMPTASCLVFKRINHTGKWSKPENWQLVDSLLAADLLLDSPNVVDDE